MIDFLFGNLERYGVASAEERRALSDAIVRTAAFGRGEDLIAEGVQPAHCIVLIEGLVCRYKLLEGGRRQIMSFHVAGDFCDLHALWLDMDHSVGALTHGRAALIPHAAIHSIIGRYPRVGEALWRMTLVDGAIFREWLVGLGRRSSMARIAHLLCELHAKFEAVGLVEGDGYELPLTQAELADALGLSVVHVNRVLQQLRASGLVTLQNRTVTIRDWEELKAVGEFDPAFLHLNDSKAKAAPRRT